MLVISRHIQALAFRIQGHDQRTDVATARTAGQSPASVVVVEEVPPKSWVISWNEAAQVSVTSSVLGRE